MGFLFLYIGISGSATVEMITVESGGGSLDGRRQVIVEGDIIPAGDRVRVLSRSLVVKVRERDVWFRFSPGTRWQFIGPIGSDNRPAIELMDGRGVISSGGQPVSLRLGTNLFTLESGRIIWDLTGPFPRVAKTPATDLYRVESGASRTRVISDSQFKEFKLRIESFPSPINPSEKPARYPGRTGTLISGTEVKNRIIDYTQRRGLPDDLKDVFGHWVRDRWGNIYYYKIKNDSGFELRTGGPDERLFTSDDRSWEWSY